MVNFGHALQPSDVSTLPAASIIPPLLKKRKRKNSAKLLIRDLPEHDPFKLYAALRRRYPTSFILESAPGPKRLAEHTFIGFAPAQRLALRGGRFIVDERDEGLLDDPLGALRAVLSEHRPSQPAALPEKYCGGLVGYLSYDFVRYLEPSTALPNESGRSPFPDFEFGLYLDGVIYDHAKRKTYYFSHDEDRSPYVLEALAAADSAAPEEALVCSPFESDLSREQFLAGVQAAQEAIRGGEIYQIVLSKALRAGYRGDLLAFYRRLRRINPSPYMYYLQFAGRTIAGSSPEMLVSLNGRRLTTYPIAGTRPLGQNESERERYRRELCADEKERAEHAMLVDLARNDVGRVSEFGSVHVPEYMSVERFSHVQHLVSRVEGRLREDLDALDALAALFPAGTVSGAPKVRAMELIDRLEATRRGPYAGVVGYLSLNGALDTAITIRTLFAEGERLYLRAGAGIVADSIPEREWDECDRKLAALLRALEGSTPCAS